MSGEPFLVLIKPDAVRRGLMGEIISRFERRGFEILKMRMLVPTRDLACNHYIGHRGRCYFDGLVDFTVSGNVVAILMSGNIDVARNLVGPTIPSDAIPGTIRGDYSCSLPENLVHCSANVENARREIELWFGE